MSNHTHDWYVFSTEMSTISLLVKCECGDVGLVGDPLQRRMGSRL